MPAIDFFTIRGDHYDTAQRANLRLAGELLKKVMRSKECPESIRLQAETVLRHYPEDWDIASQALRYDPKSAPFCWLGPEDNPSAGS